MSVVEKKKLFLDYLKFHAWKRDVVANMKMAFSSAICNDIEGLKRLQICFGILGETNYEVSQIHAANNVNFIAGMLVYASEIVSNGEL